MNSYIEAICDKTFETAALASEIPVLVDFWAESCGPCKAIAPLLDEMAQEYAGKIKIVKLNIHEYPNSPSKYGVRAIPSLMKFKNGAVESIKVESLSWAQLTEFLERNV